jgi:hypothetical protein
MGCVAAEGVKAADNKITQSRDMSRVTVGEYLLKM